MNQPPMSVLVALVAAQVISAALAWSDLTRRGDEHLRGSKKLWRAIIVMNPGNSVAYWLVGRR